MLRFMMCPFKCRCNKFFISNPTRLLFSERVHSLEIHNYVLHELGRDLFAKFRETRFPCCASQVAQIGDYGDVLSCQYRWQYPWSEIHTHVLGLLLTSAAPIGNAIPLKDRGTRCGLSPITQSWRKPLDSGNAYHGTILPSMVPSSPEIK